MFPGGQIDKDLVGRERTSVIERINAKYTDAELEALLEETESDVVERKESWKGDAPE